MSPAGPALYSSPLGLYPFQEESIAQDYLDTVTGGGKLVVWDTGTGKSHLTMRMAALHVEDQSDGASEHDLSIVVCEKGKVGEWMADFKEFTTLDVRKHYGTNRHKALAKHGLPQVLVTTYETGKSDLVRIIRPNKNKRGQRMEPGPLFEAIAGKAVTWYFDESAAKVGNRTSDTWKAYHWVLSRMKASRPTGHRVFGLTATPVERDYENVFNQCLLISPQHMPLVREFEEWFIRGRHPVWHTPRYRYENMGFFAQMVAPLVDRRRKTDPDIMAQFPKKTERSSIVEMESDQASLYSMIEELQDFEDPDEKPIPGLWTLLRLAAGHPGAIPLAARQGTSKVTQMLVQELGENYFTGTSSAKEKDLLIRLEHVVKEEGNKAVVFTFFGQTILPVLAASMRAKKFRVYTNHGGMSAADQTQSRQAFRGDPDPCIFLTSDSGARGINLPEATHVFEYESALTYANRTQRIDRIHRITSQSPTVTCTTLVVDRTVEVPILTKVSDRNAQSDLLLGDDDAGEDFMTADERKTALRMHHLTKTAYTRKKVPA